MIDKFITIICASVHDNMYACLKASKRSIYLSIYIQRSKVPFLGNNGLNRGTKVSFLYINGFKRGTKVSFLGINGLKRGTKVSFLGINGLKREVQKYHFGIYWLRRAFSNMTLVFKIMPEGHKEIELLDQTFSPFIFSDCRQKKAFQTITPCCCCCWHFGNSNSF